MHVLKYERSLEYACTRGTNVLPVRMYPGASVPRSGCWWWLSREEIEVTVCQIVNNGRRLAAFVERVTRRTVRHPLGHARIHLTTRQHRKCVRSTTHLATQHSNFLPKIQHRIITSIQPRVNLTKWLNPAYCAPRKIYPHSLLTRARLTNRSIPATSVSQACSAKTRVSALTYQLPCCVFRNDRKPVSKQQNNVTA